MHPRSAKLLEDVRDAAAHHDPATAARIGNHAQIIAFPNVLIHGYDLVDHALVWSTVEHQLPVLLREVEALLAERG